jgi:hypothetical protein
VLGPWIGPCIRHIMHSTRWVRHIMHAMHSTHYAFDMHPTQAALPARSRPIRRPRSRADHTEWVWPSQESVCIG